MASPLALASAGFAVGLLIMLALWLGFAGKPRLATEAEAAELADSVAGGFVPTTLKLDRTGSAAILFASDHRCVLVHAHGAHFVARLLSADASFSASGPTVYVTDGTLDMALEFDDSATAEAIMSRFQRADL